MTRAERLARDMARAANQAIGDTVALSSLRITKFGRHRDGYFHANLSVNGSTFYVHCRWGSWMIPESIGDTISTQRELLSPYRDVLCERMRSFQRVENQRLKAEEKEVANDPASGREGSGETVPDAGVSEGLDPEDAPVEVRHDTQVGV